MPSINASTNLQKENKHFTSRGQYADPNPTLAQFYEIIYQPACQFLCFRSFILLTSKTENLRMKFFQVITAFDFTLTHRYKCIGHPSSYTRLKNTPRNVINIQLKKLKKTEEQIKDTFSFIIPPQLAR